MNDEKPWCCNGWTMDCALCDDPARMIVHCPGHPATDANVKAVRVWQLHARRAHPGYEYATTQGPRKQWEFGDVPPTDDEGEPQPGWERNTAAGRDGWERFDYTEESYWRQPKARSGPVAAESEDLTGAFTPDPPIGCLLPGVAPESPSEVLDGPESVRQAPGGELAGRGGDRGAEAASGGSVLREEIIRALRSTVAQPGEILTDEQAWAICDQADTVLAAVREHLDIGEEQAICKTCRRVWDGPGHRCESDAEQQIARIRRVIAERRLEVAEREVDGMLDFGTPGASWCDAVTVTCDRIDDALRVFPQPGWIRCNDDQPQEQP